ncbi:MAG: dehydrogenase E1 component subunit alpha/beta [bacterium]|nr:dehydrogenase E1 component subunit alpha/beta [bacterium]
MLKKSPKKIKLPSGLTAKILLDAYELMRTSRLLDERMLIMLKQNKSFFHIGAMGHEAIQAAAALNLSPKRDWLFPYYRDQVLCLGMGETPLECLLGFLAKADDPNSGGRQMPQHYGQKDCHIPTSSSSTGTQYLQAVGCALATMLQKRITKSKNKLLNYDVTLVCSGDGTTSQGDFHEALNWASRAKAPVIFLIENNKYAISVPVSEQRAGGKVGNIANGYEDLRLIEVDGCNFIDSFVAMETAVLHARSGNGPVLVDASVVRLLPHSSSDNHNKYRSDAELKSDKKRDPIDLMRKLLISSGINTAAQLDEIDEKIYHQIIKDADKAEAAKSPDKTTALQFVDSEEGEPALLDPDIKPGSEEVVLVDAIKRALAEEMERNKKVLVFGQDVAHGKGGVFTATLGLTKRFGVDRCFNAPLAESSIVGVAIGLALRGFKPVPEIQFGDYIWTAMMQIRNELCTIRYRSNNAFNAPVVIRTPVGGYIHGGLCHSQNIEATFAHFPGLKIALPSTALDAFGLLKAAIRGNDPVLFLEHKSLYRQNFAKSKLPDDPEWILPFGKGVVRREGKDLSVITYGALVQRALEAASAAALEGIDVEVIDLRTIRPYDLEIIRDSVQKTGKIIILHEDCRFMGFGAELAAEVAENCFEYLDAPVKRIAGADSPVPYHWDLEAEVLPQTANILRAIQDLAGC